MHVDVLLAYERTESGTHGELGSHISVFCLEPLTIGGRSSCWTLLCVCLLVLFLKSVNQTLFRNTPSAILVRLKSTLKLKPHSRWLIERTGRCGRAEWSWETSTTVNVRHQWSSDLTFWLYEEKSLVLAKGLLACCHQRLETNDKRLPRYPELIWLLFLFLKK